MANFAVVKPLNQARIFLIGICKFTWLNNRDLRKNLLCINLKIWLSVTAVKASHQTIKNFDLTVRVKFAVA